MWPGSPTKMPLWVYHISSTHRDRVRAISKFLSKIPRPRVRWKAGMQEEILKLLHKHPIQFWKHLGSYIEGPTRKNAFFLSNTNRVISKALVSKVRSRQCRRKCASNWWIKVTHVMISFCSARPHAWGSRLSRILNKSIFYIFYIALNSLLIFLAQQQIAISRTI